MNTRGSRLQQLQDNHFKQQPVSPGPGRAAVVPLTTEQKDLAQAVRWFKGMGWEEAAESGAAVARVATTSLPSLHHINGGSRGY